MFKIIIMALLIFIGMVGYDNITDKAQPTTPVQQEQQKVSKHEKSAAMALFTSLLPPKEEWPSPVHKFYLAFNMDEVIDPVRQNPNWTSLDAMSRDIPQALIAIEDHAFYNHGAIAVEGILRAALANINAGEVVQGAASSAASSVASSVAASEAASSAASKAQATVEFTVTAADGSVSSVLLNVTDGEKLSTALAEAGIISQEEADAGFVTTVNGETADYDKDQAWWCLTDAAGEMTTVGVADIELHDGDSYAFTYTKG